MIRKHLLASFRGFTLIELMITVAIIAILGAVAIPAYVSYVRRSYMSEATSAFSAIKSAEEAYMQANSCYVSAAPNPSVANITTAAGGKLDWDPAPATSAWARAPMDVRPDRQVRFSYQVYASNDFNSATSTGCGAAQGKATIATIACATNLDTNVVPNAIFPTNWYIVVARADLDGDGTLMTMISAIDDTNVITCNELD